VVWDIGITGSMIWDTGITGTMVLSVGSGWMETGGYVVGGGSGVLTMKITGSQVWDRGAIITGFMIWDWGANMYGAWGSDNGLRKITESVGCGGRGWRKRAAFVVRVEHSSLLISINVSSLALCPSSFKPCL
jgi:hypothetical protein